LRDGTSIAFIADCKGNKKLLHAVMLLPGKTDHRSCLNDHFFILILSPKVTVCPSGQDAVLEVA
jgi:hypothetical protein